MIPSRCCCGDDGEPHTCMETCSNHPTQLELTITGGLVDVESRCFSDNDGGDAFCLCTTGCGGAIPPGSADRRRIDCNNAIDPMSDDAAYCAAERICEQGYDDDTQDCIDAHIGTFIICPCAILNGTFILDFVPEESLPYTYCLYRCLVPVDFFEPDYSSGRGPNCTYGGTTGSGFYWLEVLVFPVWGESEFPEGASIHAYMPWTSGLYDATTELTAEEWCEGESVEMESSGSPQYADVVTYIVRNESGSSVVYACDEGFSMKSGGWNYTCSRMGEVWPELFPVDYPGDYAKNPHYPIEITNVHSIGGEL